jgi:hypothetical protein
MLVCALAGWLLVAPAFAQNKGVDIVIVGANDELDAPLAKLVQSLTSTKLTIEQTAGEYAPLDDAKIARLNKADLIILSRSAASADYSDDVAKWNAIKAPMLMMAPYFLRSNRWNWVHSNEVQEDKPLQLKKLAVKDPKDSAFAGMKLAAAGAVQIYDDATTFTMRYLNDKLADTNGAIVATLGGGDAIPAIVRWAKVGQPFYRGGKEIVGSPRVFFGIQDDANRNPDDSYRDQLARLTPEGKRLLRNVIASLVPKAISGKKS